MLLLSLLLPSWWEKKIKFKKKEKSRGQKRKKMNERMWSKTIGLKRRIVVRAAVISVSERFLFLGIRIIRRPGCEVKTNGFPRFSGWSGGDYIYIMDSFNILCAHVL